MAEALESSLSSLNDCEKPDELPLGFTKKAVIQLAQAAAEPHVCGIAHCGMCKPYICLSSLSNFPDLHPGKFLFRIPGIGS